MGDFEKLNMLLAAAVRAPSGDNTQPWRFFVVPSKGLLSILLDEDRDRSPMNAGQRMARIAVGAAVENVLRTASRIGWRVSLVESVSPALLTLCFTLGSPAQTTI